MRPAPPRPRRTLAPLSSKVATWRPQAAAPAPVEEVAFLQEVVVPAVAPRRARMSSATMIGLGAEPPPRAPLDSATCVDAVPPGSIPPAPESRPELATIVDDAPWPAALEAELASDTPWPPRQVLAAATSSESAPPPESAPSSPDGTDLLPIRPTQLTYPLDVDPEEGSIDAAPPSFVSPNETSKMSALDAAALDDWPVEDVISDSPSCSRSIAPLTLMGSADLPPPPRRLPSLAFAALAAALTAACFLIAGEQQRPSVAQAALRAPLALVSWCASDRGGARAALGAQTPESESDQTAVATDPTPAAELGSVEPQNVELGPKAAATPPADARAKPRAKSRRAAAGSGGQWLAQVKSKASARKSSKKKKKKSKRKKASKRRRKHAKRR